jgi:major membrane immunogen (membrane-anchored lipoprotein)
LASVLTTYAARSISACASALARALSDLFTSGSTDKALAGMSPQELFAAYSDDLKEVGDDLSNAILPRTVHGVVQSDQPTSAAVNKLILDLQHCQADVLSASLAQ